MSFDPHREKLQRIGLRYAQELENQNITVDITSLPSLARVIQRYANDFNITDSERAFSLVNDAAVDIDYVLPFEENPNKAQRLIKKNFSRLQEAITLDKNCFDAERMLAASDCESAHDFHMYLKERGKEVRAYCIEQCEAERRHLWRSSDTQKLAERLAISPYLRWLAFEAQIALVCGRAQDVFALCQEAYELDKQDQAGIRYTEALAYAVQEDLQGLEAMEERVVYSLWQNGRDAWMQLAFLACAYKDGQMDYAKDLLKRLIASYPNAVNTLLYQNEIPYGVFSRIITQPKSEDEMILATSEAGVLLNEGSGDEFFGALGLWIFHQCEALDPETATKVRKMRETQQKDDTPGWYIQRRSSPRGDRS